jgi:hypothetical protein
VLMKSSLLVFEKSHSLVFSWAMMTTHKFKSASKTDLARKTTNKKRANKTDKLVKWGRWKREANGEVGERKTEGKWWIM